MDKTFPATLTFGTYQRAVRLDVFLAKNFTDYTRGDIVRAIKDGLVSVNDKIVKPHYALRLDDVIIVTTISQQNSGVLIPSTEIALDIIEDTEHFFVINKSAGVQVHPSERGEQNTLVSMLIARDPEIAEIGDNKLRPGIVHRLDKDTSGAMIIAKTSEAFEKFKELFHEKKIDKTYVALVHGIPKKKTGMVDLPIARAATYTKQKVVYGVPTPDAREALTEYSVTQTFATPHGDYALVELHPRTGRMHQVRVHMAAIGTPLIGDQRYYTRHKKQGFSEQDAALQATHHLLHAAKLAFTFDNQEYSFDAPLPDHFTAIIDKLTTKTTQKA